MPYPLPTPAPPPIVQVESDRFIDARPLIPTSKPHINPVVTLNTPGLPLPPALQAPKSAILLEDSVSLSDRLKAATVAQSNAQTPIESVAPTPTVETPTINAPNLPSESRDAPSPTTPVEIQSQPNENLPTQTQPTPQTENGAPSNVAPVSNRIVELNADRQEYDVQRQIVTAEGNVILRLNGGVIDADSLQVNLSNRIAVGQGDVALTRGEQILRGERFTYNFVQNTGELLNATGEIFIPSASQDLSVNLATDVSAGGVPANPPSDRITANQPRQDVTNTGGIGISVGAGSDLNNVALPQQGGEVRRLRFQAQQVDFYPQGWQAENVRITNDPFSPAELELRADKVTLTRETPQRDRIRTTRQRLVFDQGLSIPIPSTLR